MIIYSTISTSPEAIKAQAKAVIDGGCQWIQISACGMSKEEMKACAEAIIPICKENNTVLVLDRYVDLVDELRVHGVYLSAGSMNAAEAREKLGPHAIIGVEVNSAADILALKGKDIDYVTLGGFPATTDVNDCRTIISEIRDAGMKIPVVAYGKITIADIPALLDAGVNGFILSEEIAASFNPTETTREYFAAL